MHDRAILKSQNTSMDRGISTKKVMPPGAIARGFLQVGDDIIDCGASRIISRDPPVKITPKVLAVLLELARHQGETVARDTLLDTVWAETHPTPDVVKQAILEIRRALEYPAGSSEIVETIPRLGYRLLVKARFSETLEGLSEPETDLSDSPESIGARDWQPADIGKESHRHGRVGCCRLPLRWFCQSRHGGLFPMRRMIDLHLRYRWRNRTILLL